MKNRRVIIANGMQRGGTNIVWNLLQSHPDIVSPIYETGQIVYLPWMRRGKLGAMAMTCFRLGVRARLPPLLSRIDRELYRHKLYNLEHEDNKYKSEGVPYELDEIESAVLVTKSVGADVRMTPALAAYFPESSVISVVRNGLAVCEGWIRRGASPERAAKAYTRWCREIFRQRRRLKSHLVVRFEDCLEDPGAEFDRMCRFVGVSSKGHCRIRIKAKSVIDANGGHAPAFGRLGRKVWVDRGDVRSYLDPAVTQRQIERLAPEVRERILAIAGEAMRRFGYPV